MDICTPATQPKWFKALLVTALLSLGPLGCDNFFTTPTSGSPSSGSGIGAGAGGNFLYTANAATGTISGFVVGAGSLTAIPNTPFSLGYTPQSLALSPGNSFLYVAGATGLFGTLSAYPIASDGSLSVPSSGANVANLNVFDLAVSPDGNWLVGIDGQTTALDVWRINRSTGALSALQHATFTVTATPPISRQALRFSPNGALLFAALGSAGEVVFTFNTATGLAVESQTLAVGAQTSDNGLAVDNSGSTLYVARSGSGGGLATYAIGSAGKLTSIAGSPFSSGNGAYAVVLESTGKYVYVANRTDGTISGYAIGTGTLTALAGSPYASGATVSSLLFDRTGKYLFAGALGGSPDLTMYGFDTTVSGQLDSLVKAQAGTDPAGVVQLATTY